MFIFIYTYVSTVIPCSCFKIKFYNFIVENILRSKFGLCLDARRIILKLKIIDELSFYSSKKFKAKNVFLIVIIFWILTFKVNAIYFEHVQIKF